MPALSHMGMFVILIRLHVIPLRRAMSPRPRQRVQFWSQSTPQLRAPPQLNSLLSLQEKTPFLATMTCGKGFSRLSAARIADALEAILFEAFDPNLATALGKHRWTTSAPVVA